MHIVKAPVKYQDLQTGTRLKTVTGKTLLVTRRPHRNQTVFVIPHVPDYTGGKLLRCKFADCRGDKVQTVWGEPPSYLHLLAPGELFGPPRV